MRSLVAHVHKYDVNFVMGDFNMRLFSVEPYFKQHSQTAQGDCWPVALVAHTIGFRQGKGVSPVSLTETVHYDSMGIFAVGRHEGIRNISGAEKLLWGAAWPRVMDGKEYRNGFQHTSYSKVGGDGPDSARYNAIADNVYDEIRNFFWERELRTIYFGQKRFTYTCMTEDGEMEFQRLLEKYRGERPWQKQWASEADLAQAGHDKKTLGLIHEVQSSWQHSDKYGMFIGKNGHMTLMCKVYPLERHGRRATPQSQRTPEAKRVRKVRDLKTRIYKAGFGWPWELEHPQEKTFFSSPEQAEVNGGVFWRRAQAVFLANNGAEKLAEYEAPYIDAYGKEVYDQAMQSTEKMFQDSLREYPT